MSGHGAPVIDITGLQEETGGLKLAIVAASWHTEIMDGLVNGALRAATDAGVEDPALVRVPGAFEHHLSIGRERERYGPLVGV